MLIYVAKCDNCIHELCKSFSYFFKCDNIYVFICCCLVHSVSLPLVASVWAKEKVGEECRASLVPMVDLGCHLFTPLPQGLTLY